MKYIWMPAFFLILFSLIFFQIMGWRRLVAVQNVTRDLTVKISEPALETREEQKSDINTIYPITRIEWLALNLNNSAARTYHLDIDGFMINCQAQKDTIKIEVLYYEDATNAMDQTRREFALDSMKSCLNLLCQRYGWDSVPTKEERIKWPLALSKGEMPVEMLPYIPTRLEWNALKKLAISKSKGNQP